MQIPKRKKEDYRKYGGDGDNYLSPEAIKKLKDDLRRLEEVSRPRAVTELSRAREMGDLSENAAYSEAKGRLMGMDRRIFEIKEKLKNAVVIERGSEDGRVAVGATVVVRVNGKQKTYEIVGSAETDPGSGRISHLSPLGSALKGHQAGDEVMVKNAAGAEVRYEIVEVR
ncbi:MAG TPA: transcription elongation factor GreA [Patescibacteria group bacterium]|nr:transcription elongation factor GreA [Patescibacteria group bacterium]